MVFGGVGVVMLEWWVGTFGVLERNGDEREKMMVVEGKFGRKRRAEAIDGDGDVEDLQA